MSVYWEKQLARLVDVNKWCSRFANSYETTKQRGERSVRCLKHLKCGVLVRNNDETSKQLGSTW